MSKKKKIKCIYCDKENNQERYHKGEGCSDCGLRLWPPSTFPSNSARGTTFKVSENISRVGCHRASGGKEGRYNGN